MFTSRLERNSPLSLIQGRLVVYVKTLRVLARKLLKSTLLNLLLSLLPLQKLNWVSLTFRVVRVWDRRAHTDPQLS